MNKNQELALEVLNMALVTPIMRSAGRGYVIRYSSSGLVAVRLTDQDITELLAADKIYATKSGYRAVRW